jgi:hypothetical protein
MKKCLSFVLSLLICGVALAEPSPVQAGEENSWSPERIIPVSPVRVLDTRQPGFKTVPTDGPGATFEFSIGAGAEGAWLGVVATGSTGPGFLTVYAADASRPETSNVNFYAGETRAGTAITRSSKAGLVRVYASDPSTKVIADLTARLAFPSGGATAGRIVTVPQTRLLDTRSSQPVAAGSAATVARPSNVPADATAWIATVTVLSTAPGYVTAWAAGQPMSGTSTLNVSRVGQVNPITTLVSASSSGISIYAHDGGHVLVDIAGYVTGSSAPKSWDGVLRMPGHPVRLVDTQFNNAGLSRTAELGSLTVATPNASIAIVNVTIAGADSAGFATVFGTPGVLPDTSAANFDSGDTVANIALVAGRPTVYSTSRARVIVDLQAEVMGGSEIHRAIDFHQSTLSVPRLGITRQVYEDVDIDKGVLNWMNLAYGTEFTIFGHRSTHGAAAEWMGRLAVGDVWTITDNVSHVTQTWKVTTFQLVSGSKIDDFVTSGGNQAGPSAILFACSCADWSAGCSDYRVVATSVLISWV